MAGSPGGSPSPTGGSPSGTGRPGGSGGWTGTPGSPGAAGRPPSTPEGPPRPRTPDTPSSAARGGADAPSRPASPSSAPNAPGRGGEAPSRPDAPASPKSPDASSPKSPEADSPKDRPDSHSEPDSPNNPKDGGDKPNDPDADKPEPGTPEYDRKIDDGVNNSQRTDAGMSGHTDPNMQDLARRVPDDGEHFTVDAHHGPDGVDLGGRNYSPDELADVLRRSGWDGHSPIRMLSCDSGDFASDLARRLGVDVTAPNGNAWSDGSGNVFASTRAPDGGPTWPPDGGWNTHHPDGSNSPASNDGFHPGRDGEDPGDRPEEAEARNIPEPKYPKGMSKEEKLQNEDYIDHHYYDQEVDGTTRKAVNAHRSPDLDGENPTPIRQKTDDNGNPVTDDEGNPVYEENPKSKDPGKPPEFMDRQHYEYGDGHPRNDDPDHSSQQDSADEQPQDQDGDRPSTQDWREESLRRIDQAIEERRARMDARDAAEESHGLRSDEHNSSLGRVSQQSEVFGEEVSYHAERERLETEFNEPGGSENTLHHTNAPGEPDFIEIRDADGNVIGTAEQRQSPGPGAGKFDSVWEVTDYRSTPPETRFDVVEAKAPNGTHSTRELPDGTVVRQCRRDYLEDIIRQLKQADVDTPEHKLGKDLQNALDEKRLRYEEVRARAPRKEPAPDGRPGETVDVYDGYVRKPVDLHYDDED